MDALKDPKLNIIPIGDDFKGCKVLLTLRSRDVLSHEMSTEKEFKLEVLRIEFVGNNSTLCKRSKIDSY